jgi:hypothetical protein
MAPILAQELDMLEWLKNQLDALTKLWVYIWFQDKNTVSLDVMRIGLGFLMFLNYGLYNPVDIIALYGDAGLLSRDVVPEIYHFTDFSLFVLFEQSWQLLTFHYVFVALCFCFFIGWQTRWIKWLMLIGQLSYMNRNEFAAYGVDTVLLLLLLLLCIAPIGSALSVDRARRVRKFKVVQGSNAVLSLPTSQIGFACQRLMQLQMAVIYFSSGAEKLRGNSWWSGEAPWAALVNNSTAFFPLGVFANNFWIINLMAFGTIFIEISYAFLIWGAKTRPYLLVAALSLHLGIAIFMGMYYFAALMAVGHLAFMRRSWYVQGGQWWNEKISNMKIGERLKAVITISK